ncbi:MULTISPECIES: ester cyclase [Haloarcula]|uniref:Ester cyclase n=1 Tax=Haloarcula pellucida TaxID=1427151 RepID=A0A830GNN0_9EURY|nr:MULTISPECIES: ester cyclase [Halomicroarcula]MBX0349979.1 ester cyclase [Halomicroarcula pellucida]MDS0279728.1 ester cyclase [Halomicroarcula sp. S1AR25-4]GGN95345.1 hypothetical protein GCM10009030_22540 [Halomicroarcula pellucida]
MPEVTAEVENLIRDYERLWNEGNYAEIPTLAADSFVLHDPGYPETVRGRDAFETYLRELREGFPDFHVEIEDMATSGGTVMAKWTMTGTHEGEFAEIPPTGNSVELEGMDTVEIADGTVQEHRIYYDSRALFEQVGLTDE